MKRLSKSPSRLQRFLDRVEQMLRSKPEPEPEDPFAYRTAPLKRPPRGRSGAAVAELDEE